MHSDDPIINIGVNASLAHAYLDDHKLFVEQLTSILQSTMPHAIKVKWKGGLFSEKQIVKVTIEMDGIEHVLELAKSGAYIPQKARVVGGIRLKTETVTMKEWFESLTTLILEAAENHQAAQEAFSRITGN